MGVPPPPPSPPSPVVISFNYRPHRQYQWIPSVQSGKLMPWIRVKLDKSTARYVYSFCYFLSYFCCQGKEKARRWEECSQNLDHQSLSTLSMYARRFFKPLQLYVILNIFSSAEWNFFFFFLLTWKSNNANIFGCRCFICANIHSSGILNNGQGSVPRFQSSEAPSTLSRWNLKTQQSPAILDLRLRKIRSGKSNDNRN